MAASKGTKFARRGERKPRKGRRRKKGERRKKRKEVEDEEKEGVVDIAVMQCTLSPDIARYRASGVSPSFFPCRLDSPLPLKVISYHVV